MKCPNCGVLEEHLDWHTDDKDNMVWNCFECEHIWKISMKEN